MDKNRTKKIIIANLENYELLDSINILQDLINDYKKILKIKKGEK